MQFRSAFRTCHVFLIGTHDGGTAVKNRFIILSAYSLHFDIIFVKCLSPIYSGARHMNSMAPNWFQYPITKMNSTMAGSA